MASVHLPKVQIIAAPIGPVVMLCCIGSQLRSHYADVLNEPMPESPFGNYDG
jgi:hypothetical protein